jgi:uncharacterized membrane protein
MDKTEILTIMLTPHRSLTRQGFVLVMALVAAVNLVAGLAFLAIGAWPVMMFCGLDVLIVWWAFRRNFADAREAERIVFDGDKVTLARISKDGSTRNTEFNRRWLSVELEYDDVRELVGRLLLRSHGKVHEIASFLGAEERQSLASALRQHI